MSKVAKLFKNGSSQAVRLPREFRFEGDKVKIRRVGDAVVLEPYALDPDRWLAKLRAVPQDADFMPGRKQPNTPKRRIFE